MTSTVASSFLVGATFLQYIAAAIGKQCSYSQYGDTTYYTCPNNERCCGGSCCYPNDYYYSVYDLWYFWFCLCFGIFICSLVSGAYYRKRQLRGVQVAAVQPRGQAGHLHGNAVPVMPGAMVGRLGADGLVHPHPRNVMVTTTGSSGQPLYPPQPYFNGPAPSYAMCGPAGGHCGPVYPAYAYLPPPPSYSSLGTDPAVSPFSSSSSSSESTRSSTGSGSDVAPVSA